MQKKYLPYLLLVLFSIPLYFLNIHEVHGWGDDFSQYIKEAENIAKGKPYHQSDYVFNHMNPEYGPPQYPPGFPILLAPVIKFFGLAIKPMNYFMSFMMTCLLFVLYAYYRKFAGTAVSICLALVCVYAGGVIEFKSSILSDIPCWLFVALYFLIRHNTQFPPWRIALLVLVITMAILIRTQSGMVLVAEGLYLAYHTLRRWYNEKKISFKGIFTSVSFKVMVFSTALFLFLNQFVFNAPNSTLAYYKTLSGHRTTSLWEAIGSNSSYFLVLILRAFHYYTSDAFLNVLTEASVYIIFTFAIIGFIKLVRKRVDVADVYFVILVGFLFYFSQHQGLRFIFSLLPIYLLYAYIGMRDILPAILKVNGRKLAIAMTVIFFAVGYNDLQYRSRPITDNINYTLFPEDLEAFKYIRENVKSDEIIVFEKARCLSLFTGKKAVTSAWQVSIDMNKQFYDSLGVKYLLTCSDFNNEFYDNYLKAVPPPLDTFDIAPGYKLYQLR